MMNDPGKSVIVIGIVLIVMGVLMTIAGKIPGIGKLPGDIFIKKENFGFYFPFTTCILLSILISAIMYLIGRK
jgi:hypothetical protein